MGKHRKYTDEEKKQILQEVEETGNMAAVAKKNDMPAATIQTWIKPKYKARKKSAGVDEVSDLKNQLKNAELENQILKELLKKTYQIWSTD